MRELDLKNDPYYNILLYLLTIGKIGPNEFRDDLGKYESFLKRLGE